MSTPQVCPRGLAALYIGLGDPKGLTCFSLVEKSHCTNKAIKLIVLHIYMTGPQWSNVKHIQVQGCVLVQINIRCMLLHVVSSAFIVVCPGYKVQVQGNVQVWRLMLGEHGCAATMLQPCYYG